MLPDLWRRRRIQPTRCSSDGWTTSLGCLCPKRKRMPRSIRKTVDHEGWFGPFARQPDNVGQARSVSTKLVSETVVREP
jgi:hypothetical protein